MIRFKEKKIQGKRPNKGRIGLSFTIFIIRDGELFGSELPQTAEDFEKIKALRIKVIISLAEEINIVKSQINFTKDFEHYELFIEDYTTPTPAQVKRFLEILKEKKREQKAVLVHCIGGCGRTGLMLALAERFLYNVFDGKKSIAKIREIRSCALETPEQEEFVINFDLDGFS